MNACARKPLIIPVFIPHSGCPHQCAFCNQRAITGEKQPSPSLEKLHTVVEEFLGYNNKQRSCVQIAFYGGNFLGLKPERIGSLLKQAASFVQSGKIDSIRFSTRPDTVTADRLHLLEGFPVNTIELGAQSMDNTVLSMVQRGHTAEDTEAAVDLLKARDYEIGLQLMAGLPGEDESSCISSGHRIADLSPDFVRIYPTVVLKDSLLAEWYLAGRYLPLTLRSAVSLAKTLYYTFRRKNIQVIRMGLQPSEALQIGSSILAGPYHPSFGELVYSEIYLEKAAAVLKTIEGEGLLQDTVLLKVHPKGISKMRGHRNQNIEKLKNRFGLKSIQIVSDPSISETGYAETSSQTPSALKIIRFADV